MRGATGVLFVAAVALGACAHAPTYHATAQTKFPPKAPNCPLAIAASHPDPGYEEIGVIAIGGYYYQDPNAFLDAMRADVCAAGGDLVITEVNGYGAIARGVVFRKRAGASLADGGQACFPICSPGFGCERGTCIPLCNPACGADERCGPDRLCHPSR